MLSLPVTRCLSVSNGFLPKEATFIFSHRLIMENSQNWPSLGSLVSKFRDIHFIDTVTDISRWKVQGDRSFGVMTSIKVQGDRSFGVMTSIQTFSEVRSFDVTWWPDLEWPGSEIFTTRAKNMYEQVHQKRRREISAKNLRGCSNTTPRPGAG